MIRSKFLVLVLINYFSLNASICCGYSPQVRDENNNKYTAFIKRLFPTGSKRCWILLRWHQETITIISLQLDVAGQAHGLCNVPPDSFPINLRVDEAMEIKCLAQGHNPLAVVGLESRTTDSESCIARPHELRFDKTHMCITSEHTNRMGSLDNDNMGFF